MSSAGIIILIFMNEIINKEIKLNLGEGPRGNQGLVRNSSNNRNYKELSCKLIISNIYLSFEL